MKFAQAALAALSFAGIMHSASAVVITSTPQTFNTNGNAVATFDIDDTYNGNVLIDFSFSYTGTLANNTFAGLWFGNWQAANIGLKANCETPAGNCKTQDVFVRTQGDKGPWVPDSNLVAGQTYKIVGYLQKVDGSKYYNRFDAWLNPGTMNLAELATIKHATGTGGGAKLTSFDTMGIRTANISSQTVTFSNINIAQIPEPGSVALMALALACMGAAARRKRK
ncbi:PEP-CTERM sorting domain-containing protein [Massilia sp. SYSU DXS3249]